MRKIWLDKSNFLIFLFIFLKKLKKTQIAFEITWPLPFTFEDQWSNALRHYPFLHCKVQVQMAAKNHDFYYIFSSDEFELKFAELSQADLKESWNESIQDGSFKFASWNWADNMYVNMKQILVPTPKLQSNFLTSMNTMIYKL